MYEELLKNYGMCEGLVGTNEHGEFVMLSIDDECAQVRTLQSNGWHRINIYWKDGTSDETYER